MNILRMFFCFLILSSCGIYPLKEVEKQSDRHLTYSTDVLLEFEDIERYESLKKYRESYWEDSPSHSPPRKKQKKYRPPTKPRTPPPSPKKKKQKRVTPKPLSSKAQELQVEIDQNLIYFCMKHRKNPRFKSVDKCNSFAQQKLNRCLRRQKQRLNRKVLKCVKKALHHY